jgi:hypothetical protein
MFLFRERQAMLDLADAASKSPHNTTKRDSTRTTRAKPKLLLVFQLLLANIHTIQL